MTSVSLVLLWTGSCPSSLDAVSMLLLVKKGLSRHRAPLVYHREVSWVRSCMLCTSHQLATSLLAMA